METACVNKKDFLYFDNIDTIDENDLVRLKNGACWHIESLIEYIKKLHGKNDATRLDNYPSDKIWDDDNDLREIFDNPYARDINFEDWYFSGERYKVARNISDKTLETINKTANLLSSKGKYFDKMFNEQLTQEEQMVWKKYTKMVRGKPITVPDNEVDPFYRRTFKDASYKVTNQFKKNALTNMYFYYKTLPETEKDSLKYFYNDIEKDLNNCINGTFCVKDQGVYLEKLLDDIKDLSER